MVCDREAAERKYWQSFREQKDFACVASPLKEPREVGAGRLGQKCGESGLARGGRAVGRSTGRAGGARWVAKLPAVPTNQLFVEFGRRDETSGAGCAVQAVAAGALWPVRHQSQYRI